MYILGFDIGGTKCAVVTAEWDEREVKLLKKEKCDTNFKINPEEMIEKLMSMADSILDKKPDAIGISCGGPLDSERGIILGPPNLPGWDYVEIVKKLESHYKVPVKLQNDANACAVAEWKFGAGKGCKNMVFLTFGTGLGAGLILDGRLYSGTNGNAGEVGHIRLAPDGPVGFGKKGSFEGFCSGGGIAQLGKMMLNEDISAKEIAERALAGDEKAIEVYRASGNAKNVVAAVKVARATGIKVIAFTGKDSGVLRDISDICIIAPENETFKIQELHLPIYHYLCAAVEKHFFGA